MNASLHASPIAMRVNTLTYYMRMLVDVLRRRGQSCPAERDNIYMQLSRAIQPGLKLDDFSLAMIAILWTQTFRFHRRNAIHLHRRTVAANTGCYVFNFFFSPKRITESMSD